jgi:hypothetical protein
MLCPGERSCAGRFFQTCFFPPCACQSSCLAQQNCHCCGFVHACAAAAAAQGTKPHHTQPPFLSLGYLLSPVQNLKQGWVAPSLHHPPLVKDYSCLETSPPFHCVDHPLSGALFGNVILACCSTCMPAMGVGADMEHTNIRIE